MQEGISRQSNLVLAGHHGLVVRQGRELAELFGFETRNKYVVLDEQGLQIAFAAEQQKGFLGFLFRQLLGHWRTFDIQIFDQARQPVYRAHHPFRWFFQRLEVYDIANRRLGAIQQRFAFFTKRFDIEDRMGLVVMQTSSPIWKPWTFPFTKGGRGVATVAKNWSGLLTEIFTDRDNFRITFEDSMMPEHERVLVLAASLFIDLQYFERKAKND
jgi:uncharacterized protein YxjI